MPPLVGREPFRSQTNLGGQAKLELVVRNLQESQQFSREDTDVLFVDERIRQLQCSPADGDVAIAQAVENDGSVPLDCIGVHRNDLVEGVERNIATRLSADICVCGIAHH